MAISKNAVIELVDVWKTYAMGGVPVHALRGLSLVVEKEDFVVVLGSSGSGKSTFMNMVGALDVPTKGKIFLDGKDISHFDESHLAQLRGQKIGFIFQQFNLIPSLSAWQNVALPMIFQGKSKEEREARAKELLASVGLGERMEHRPSQLSGGEQQRVAIARALANDPDMILADEPTGNLDSKTGKQIMDLISRLHEDKKKTIVMVTHDLDLVAYAHKTIYLKDGQVTREDRRKREIKKHEKGHSN